MTSSIHKPTTFTLRYAVCKTFLFPNPHLYYLLIDERDQTTEVARLYTWVIVFVIVDISAILKLKSIQGVKTHSTVCEISDLEH